MNKYYFLLLTFILFIGCKEENSYLKKPFFDSQKMHIGDSIFIDNFIDKIVFADSSFLIDSIIFNRYNSNNLKSMETFKNGKKIFENKYYFENGNIKKYIFFSQESENYFYERLYYDNGILKKINGYLFFQGNIIDTNSKSLEVKKGSTILYRIYYPNPPDCKVNLYIKYDDGTLHAVFQKSKFLNFLQIVYQDNDELGIFKTNILLELKEESIDTTTRYNQQLIFKVIP